MPGSYFEADELKENPSKPSQGKKRILLSAAHKNELFHGWVYG